jgi:hypothetical protein
MIWYSIKYKTWFGTVLNIKHDLEHKNTKNMKYDMRR